MGAGWGPGSANPAQQGEALRATGRGEKPPAPPGSGGGGGGGTRGEITPEQCRFRLKMLPATGVHVECPRRWGGGGMHVDAPGVCGALYPHPTGAHICTRPQSHPHSSGLRVELVKTSQPAERARGREGPGGGRPQPGEGGEVSEAWLPFIPHPHPGRQALPCQPISPSAVPRIGTASSWRQPCCSPTLSMVLPGSRGTTRLH